MNLKRIQLGRLLIEKNLITQEQLDSAIVKQSITGQRLGKILVEMGFLEEEQILRLLSEQLQVPFFDLKNYKPNPEVISLLPEMLARRYQCIVLEKTNDEYLVGMVDPQDIIAFDELSQFLKKTFRIALVRENEFIKILDMVYRHAAEITNLAEALSVEIGKNEYDINKLDVGLSLADAPVVKLLQTIFQDAVQVNASDVHIEPDEDVLRIRQRIDGILHEHILKEKNVADALALRLKLMAGLNIAEKRLPQDGRFSIKMRERNFDIRLSTLPGQFGESVVLRLLNQSAKLLNLDQIGLSASILKELRKIISCPNGLFLITGPTGSGKTTLLYAILHELNKPDVKILTVEDPVEYHISRVTQVQVQSKIDLTFSRVLRAILRQDPDIIMIGELRDQETVEIAIRAAMTGHFVFATLHTNDAISSAERMIDMGAEGYLVAAVLRGVMSQRLVRRICQNCITDYIPSEQEELWLSGIKGLSIQYFQFKTGKGCSYCYHSGYKGQYGIFELLEIDRDLGDALRKQDMIEFHRLAHISPNFKPLLLGGLDLVASGITTIAEIMRISGESFSEELVHQEKVCE